MIAVRCGNDLIMTTPDFFEGAQQALREGLLLESEIDAPVRRILELKFRMGLFENPRRPDEKAQAIVIARAEHRAVNLRAERESIVLLKNDGILPLAAERLRKVAVIGPNADSAVAQLGDWSLGSTQYGSEKGTQPRECTVTVRDGLVAYAEGRFEITYAAGCNVMTDDTGGIAEALSLAEAADLTVVVAGDDLAFIGESRSTATLEPPGGQRALLSALAASEKPWILVLVNSKPLVVPEAVEHAAAVVECFNPGMLGGTALAELLFGELNPSGKLTVSIPRHVGQLPVFYSQLPMQHGDRYADLTQEPLFPFGFGLSYTRYEYANLRVSTPNPAPGQAIAVEVELRNAGERDGVEIAQVYVHDLVTSVTWPSKKLVAFQRVALRAGETKTVRFSLPYSALALVDAFEKSVVEPGDFDLLVGGSSRDADLLRARVSVEGEPFSFARIPGVADAAGTRS